MKKFNTFLIQKEQTESMLIGGKYEHVINKE